MLKIMREFFIDTFYDNMYHLSDKYKKAAATISVIITVLGSITLGTIVIFTDLAKAGCAISIPFFSLMGTGICGLGLGLLSIVFLGLITHIGLAAIPEWIINERKNWKNGKRTTLINKAKIITDWFKTNWKTILIVIACIIAIMLSSYLLGYFAWLLAC